MFTLRPTKTQKASEKPSERSPVSSEWSSSVSSLSTHMYKQVFLKYNRKKPDLTADSGEWPSFRDPEKHVPNLMDVICAPSDYNHVFGLDVTGTRSPILSLFPVPCGDFPIKCYGLLVVNVGVRLRTGLLSSFFFFVLFLPGSWRCEAAVPGRLMLRTVVRR